MRAIIKEINDRYGIIKVEGEIDALTCGEFEKKLNSVTEKVSMVILEFDQVTYISSAGIRVLFMTLQKLLKVNGFLAITNLSQEVKEILEMVGFQNFVKFYGDIKEAQKDINGESI